MTLTIPNLTVADLIEYLEKHPRLGEKVSPEEIKCATLLESKGLRLILDFTLSDATSLVWELIPHKLTEDGGREPRYIN